MLIAQPAAAGPRLDYAIGYAGRVSQVVRQRSAKPPPRVRIPHSPPKFECVLTPASPFTPWVTATVTATPLDSGGPERTQGTADVGLELASPSSDRPACTAHPRRLA